MTDKTSSESLAAKLKRYRLHREWSLDHLSKVTGLAVSALWNIENGNVEPQELTVHKLKRTLPGLLDDPAA